MMTFSAAVPPNIQIGARIYKIELTPNLIDDTGNRSECWNRKCIIKVEERQSEQMRMSSLLHELLHAIGALYLGNESFLDENHIEALANGIHQVLTELGIKLIWGDSNVLSQG